MNNYLWDSEREVLCYAKTGEPVGLNDLPDATLTTPQAERRAREEVYSLHRHLNRKQRMQSWMTANALARLKISPRFIPYTETNKLGKED